MFGSISHGTPRMWPTGPSDTGPSSSPAAWLKFAPCCAGTTSGRPVVSTDADSAYQAAGLVRILLGGRNLFRAIWDSSCATEV